MNKKKWWKSRTLRFNALIAALSAIEASAHLVQSLFPVSVYGILLVLVIVGNSVLRAITTHGLAK